MRHQVGLQQLQRLPLALGDERFGPGIGIVARQAGLGHGGAVCPEGRRHATTLRRGGHAMCRNGRSRGDDPNVGVPAARALDATAAHSDMIDAPGPKGRKDHRMPATRKPPSTAKTRTGAPAGASNTSPLTEHDIYLFREGTHAALYDKLGCQLDRARRALRGVGAERARGGGDRRLQRLERRAPIRCARAATVRASGKRVRRRRDARRGCYKYRISARDGARLDKADPFAFYAEVPPPTGVARLASSTTSGTTASGWRSARARNALRRADVDLRGAPGLVARGATARFLDYRELARRAGATT